MRVRSSLARLGVLLALAGGGAGALVAGPAAPALGATSSGLVLKVAVGSPTTLLARGAAVTVPMKALCTSTDAFLNVQVTERAGNSIVSGYGFTEVTCTRSTQSVTLTVADSSFKAFRKGSALAQASIFACVDKTCVQQNASRVIQIAKP